MRRFFDKPPTRVYIFRLFGIADDKEQGNQNLTEQG